MMEVWVNSAWMLDLQISVDEQLPDDTSLVPKHVGVGTWYELRFVIYIIVF